MHYKGCLVIAILILWVNGLSYDPNVQKLCAAKIGQCIQECNRKNAFRILSQKGQNKYMTKKPRTGLWIDSTSMKVKALIKKARLCGHKCVTEFPCLKSFKTQLKKKTPTCLKSIPMCRTVNCPMSSDFYITGKPMTKIAKKAFMKKEKTNQKKLKKKIMKVQLLAQLVTTTVGNSNSVKLAEFSAQKSPLPPKKIKGESALNYEITQIKQKDNCANNKITKPINHGIEITRKDMKKKEKAKMEGNGKSQKIVAQSYTPTANKVSHEAKKVANEDTKLRKSIKAEEKAKYQKKYTSKTAKKLQNKIAKNAGKAEAKNELITNKEFNKKLYRDSIRDNIKIQNKRLKRQKKKTAVNQKIMDQLLNEKKQLLEEKIEKDKLLAKQYKLEEKNKKKIVKEKRKIKNKVLNVLIKDKKKKLKSKKDLKKFTHGIKHKIRVAIVHKDLSDQSKIEKATKSVKKGFKTLREVEKMKGEQKDLMKNIKNKEKAFKKRIVERYQHQKKEKKKIDDWNDKNIIEKGGELISHAIKKVYKGFEHDNDIYNKVLTAKINLTKWWAKESQEIGKEVLKEGMEIHKKIDEYNVVNIFGFIKNSGNFLRLINV